METQTQFQQKEKTSDCHKPRNQVKPSPKRLPYTPCETWQWKQYQTEAISSKAQKSELGIA